MSLSNCNSYELFNLYSRFVLLLSVVCKMINKFQLLSTFMPVLLVSLISAQKEERKSLLCPKQAAGPNEDFEPIIVYYKVKSDQDIRIDWIVGLNRWHEEEIESFLENGFDLKLPTLIYSHGYTESQQIKWLKQIRHRYAELSARGPVGFNLLLFDWSTVSSRSYPDAASFVPNLGKSLAQFMLQMYETYHYGPDKFHALTFSLSNHIFGMAGRILKKQYGLELGQITALDPTGVCFHDNTEFGEAYKLRPSDAKFVVARHYDKFAFGAHQNIGLVDILVNGGEHQTIMHNSIRQHHEHVEIPENDKSLIGNAVDKFFSHFKTLEHECNPKPDDCFEVAYQCRDYESFLKGACGSCGSDGSKCYYLNNMDEAQRLHLGSPLRKDSHVYKPNTLMFIKTSINMTCLQHYQVIANFKEEVDELISNREIVFMLNSSEYFEPKFKISTGKYTELITISYRLILPEQLRLRVESKRKFDLVANRVKSIKIRFLSHPNIKIRQQLSSNYCPTNTTGLDGFMVKCSST